MRPASEIFFSYAWGDEHQQNEAIENIVDRLYLSLLNDGFRVVRDKYNLEYKGLITDFMGRIGEGMSVVVAVSQKYVRSPYCMFELYEIARNSNFDKRQFAEKVFPVMVEFIDFSDPQIIDEHFAFWEAEFNEWDGLVKRRSGQLSVEQMQRYDKIKMIYQNFGKLTDWIIDMNSLTPQVLSADNFGEIKRALIKKGETGGRVRGFSPVRLVRMPVFWIVLLTAGAFLVYRGYHRAVGGVPDKEATVTAGKDSIHTDSGRKQQQLGRAGPPAANRIDSTKHPGGRENREDKPIPVDPPIIIKMCTAICVTKGVAGVEVSFTDPRTQKRYSLESNGADVEFTVPCYLLDQTLSIRFRRNDTTEERNFRLKDMEIPNVFKK